LFSFLVSKLKVGQEWRLQHCIGCLCSEAGTDEYVFDSHVHEDRSFVLLLGNDANTARIPISRYHKYRTEDNIYELSSSTTILAIYRTQPPLACHGNDDIETETFVNFRTKLLGCQWLSLDCRHRKLLNSWRLLTLKIWATIEGVRTKVSVSCTI